MREDYDRVGTRNLCGQPSWWGHSAIVAGTMMVCVIMAPISTDQFLLRCLACVAFYAKAFSNAVKHDGQQYHTQAAFKAQPYISADFIYSMSDR
jgi:hypothetical protein